MLCAGSKYLVTRRFVERGILATGGTHLVLRAFDTTLEREVAVKRVLPEVESNQAVVARLTEEARITSSLEHPNIPPVYDLGVDDRGVSFMCMKLLKGATLAETIERAGAARLEPGRLASLLEGFVRACYAVSFAHAQSIVHRDLKPANVMICADRTYVIDWGVACRCGEKAKGGPAASLDEDEMLCGTPSYMAPEQLWPRSERVDVRTDVFGLGAVLYQILTGEPPHEASRLVRMLALQAWEPIVPAEELGGDAVPPELSRIAFRAMARDPGDRHPSVASLAADVASFLSRGAPTPSSADLFAAELGRTTSR
jgi:serine/threonine-protein kinase